MSDFSDFQGLALLVIFICLVWSSYVDFKKFILPDFLTLMVFMMGLVVAAADPLRVDLVEGFIGAFVGFTASWGLRWGVYYLKKQEALGYGDVKLFGAAGIWVGAEGIISVAFYGSLLTLIGVMIKWAITRKVSLNEIVPFGPGIAAGLMVTLLFGQLDQLLSSF